MPDKAIADDPIIGPLRPLKMNLDGVSDSWLWPESNLDVLDSLWNKLAGESLSLSLLFSFSLNLSFSVSLIPLPFCLSLSLNLSLTEIFK